MIEVFILVCVAVLVLVVVAQITVRKLAQIYFKEKEAHIKRVLNLADKRGE